MQFFIETSFEKIELHIHLGGHIYNTIMNNEYNFPYHSRYERAIRNRGSKINMCCVLGYAGYGESATQASRFVGATVSRANLGEDSQNRIQNAIHRKSDIQKSIMWKKKTKKAIQNARLYKYAIM